MAREIPERLAVVETTLKNHEELHVVALTEIAKLKDRLFSVMLSVTGSCVVACCAMAFYIIQHVKGG